MTDPRVSVVVPIFNTSQYIERCVRSLINQTLREIEIILVNDGSTDDSHEVIKRLAQLDSRISLVHFDTNVGTFHARLSGMQVAKGEYIGTVDSDDWVHTEMYRKLYDEAKAHNCDIVECGLWSVSTGGKLRRLEWCDHFVRELNQRQIVTGVLARRIWHIMANKIFHSSIVKESLSFLETIDEKIIVADDKLITFPMYFRANKYRHLHQRMYYYRQREHSSSNNRSLAHDLRHIRDTFIVDKHIRRFLNSNTGNSDLLSLLDRNEAEELDLSLKNISNYECRSHDRNALYEELITQYGSRYLALSHGEVRRDPATGDIIVPKKSGFRNAGRQFRGSERYLYLLLKTHYPVLSALYTPVHVLFLFGYKTAIRIREILYGVKQ